MGAGGHSGIYCQKLRLYCSRLAGGDGHIPVFAAKIARADRPRRVTPPSVSNLPDVIAPVAASIVARYRVGAGGMFYRHAWPRLKLFCGYHLSLTHNALHHQRSRKPPVTHPRAASPMTISPRYRRIYRTMPIRTEASCGVANPGFFRTAEAGGEGPSAPLP